jgi:hypothetical protein
MNTVIWKHKGSIKVTLTTESSQSHYKIPVLRVEHPQGTSDCGPADIVPRDPDEAPGCAADLLLAIHRAKPLAGEVLEGAKAFLSQWPEGPQL